MRKNDLAEIKKMEIKTILTKVKQTRSELMDLAMDKNIGKLKDLKLVKKKRRDLAQLLTVLRQKQLLKQLQDQNE